MPGTHPDDLFEAQTRAPDDARALVAYATRGGSTREIAGRIAGRIEARGGLVAVRPAGEVDDLAPYAAVVLGSAVQNGRWLPEVDAFVRRHGGALAERPTWLFSVGSFGDRRRIIGPMIKGEPKNIDAIRDLVCPRDYRVFAGVIDVSSWPWYGRLFLRLFGGRPGDNRDWADIEAWADGIGRALAVPAGTERSP